jgi:hypothetical protein
MRTLFATITAYFDDSGTQASGMSEGLAI